ncbi:MAG: hypothetical protein Q9N34_03650 [Aquificota bacterium]|nr:hypothetical protein [Aquificota bacterium]
MPRESHLDGYVALFTEESLFGVVIFQGPFLLRSSVGTVPSEIGLSTT